MRAETTGDFRTYYNANYGKSFIFVENGITFSVYPDGEFDFYINDRVNVGANVSFGNSSLTFNSGFNYNPFVQYDDYGAVIQVENIPIYYDFYGRVSQIGDVNIWYRNGRLRRIGGMRVFYNDLGYFNYCTGYINVYNRFYVYRPFHRFFVRPAIGYCQVFTTPYRRYYYPVRYTYYRPYYHNYRRSYARVGRPYHHYDRGYKRDRIYRNDRRVAVRKNHGRNEYGHRRGTNRYANNRSEVSSRTARRTTTARTGNEIRNSVNRSSVVRRTDPDSRTVRRTVTSREHSSNRGTKKVNTRTNVQKKEGRSVTRSYKPVERRSPAVTRNNGESNKRDSYKKTNKVYQNRTKSAKTVSSRPQSRTSRNADLARSSSKGRSSKTVQRSSRDKKVEKPKYQNSRRVR